MNKIKLFLLSLLMVFSIGFATTSIATASSTQDKNLTTAKSETITKYVKSNGGLILRKEAHSKGAKVGMLKDGSKVTVHSTTKSGWSHVTAGKLQGYANDSYLFTKNATNTSTQTTTANSTSKGIGNVKGTVVWKYNDFIGIKGDGGAKIFLFSKSAKYKNYTKQELFDWLEGETTCQTFTELKLMQMVTTVLTMYQQVIILVSFHLEIQTDGFQMD